MTEQQTIGTSDVASVPVSITTPQSDPWAGTGVTPPASAQPAQPAQNGTPSTNTVDMDTLGALQLSGVSIGIRPGNFSGVLSDAKIIKTQKKNAPEGVMQYKLVLTYKDTKEGDSITEFKNLGVSEWPGEGLKPDEDNERDRKWLKSRLVNLGVPEDQCDNVRIKDLIGTPVYFTVKENNGYKNVTFAKINDDSVAQGGPVGVTTATTPPAATTGLSF